MYSWDRGKTDQSAKDSTSKAETGCYLELDSQIAAREKAFTYRSPTATQVPRFALIRSEANRLAQVLNTNCPPSRELSLALTHLDEVVMFGNAAIARNESPA